MYWNEVWNDIIESFQVFAHEILSKETKIRNFDELLDLPWQDKEIEKYILSPQDLRKKWMELYLDIKPFFSGLDSQIVTEIFKVARNFVIKVLCEMKDRLPFRDPILKASLCAFFESPIFQIEPWQILAKQFRNIIPLDENSNFQGELKRMECNYEKRKTEFLDSPKTIVERWEALQPHYPLISNLAKSLLVLPHTSAPVERIFAQMQDFVPPKRNRLTTENLEASLLVHQFQEVIRGYDFPITDSMIHHYLNLEEDIKQPPNIQNEIRNEVFHLEKDEASEALKTEISQSKDIASNLDFAQQFMYFFRDVMLRFPLKNSPSQNPVEKSSLDEIIETDEENSSVEEEKPKKKVQTKVPKAPKAEPQIKTRAGRKRKTPVNDQIEENDHEKGEKEKEKSEEKPALKKTKKSQVKNKK